MTRPAGANDTMTARIAVFTRLPRPGQSKTRLIPALGTDGAALLQRRMTMHCLTSCRRFATQSNGPQLEVRFTDSSRNEIRRWLGTDLKYSHQGGGNLGERLTHAFDDAFRDGVQKMVVIGTDCPSLKTGLLEDALNALDQDDIVLGPAADGGYYLIGLRARVQSVSWAQLFGIDWGSERVMKQTLEQARGAHLKIAQLETLPDIDRPEDLPEWKKIENQTAHAPESRLAVIIPTRNEEKNAARIVKEAKAAVGTDVYVVDGGSTDNTKNVAAEAGATVLASPPGRARQMNLGAQATSAPFLFFTHADSQLPEACDAYIRYFLQIDGISAGAFQFQTDNPAYKYRILAKLANWRSRILHRPYGDQGLFLTRSTFEALGGFPEQPLMEDFEFVRRLRRRGRIAIAPVPLITSARRWEKLGLVRTTLRNLKIIAAYKAGVSPERLAAWYRRD